jgi:hypothetical protein
MRVRQRQERRPGRLRCAALCCAVLRCAVLCCAVLCCAALCSAVLRCAAPPSRRRGPRGRMSRGRAGRAGAPARRRAAARRHHPPRPSCPWPASTWGRGGVGWGGVGGLGAARACWPAGCRAAWWRERHGLEWTNASREEGRLARNERRKGIGDRKEGRKEGRKAGQRSREGVARQGRQHGAPEPSRYGVLVDGGREVDVLAAVHAALHAAGGKGGVKREPMRTWVWVPRRRAGHK